MTPPPATSCPRPDCDGELEDDGFCDTCGRAAPAPAAVGAAVAGAAAGGTSGAAAGPPTAASPPTAGVPAAAGSSAGSSTGSTAGGGPATAASDPGTGPRTGPFATGATASGRTRSGRSRTTAGRRIGGGLVPIAPEPERDPAEAVLSDPRVPEESRFCGACESPVGRGRDGRPGRAEGFCPTCGTRFSFTPSLSPGDLVDGQYEVLGCLAHGGLGWVYLARDRKVRDRWVVLKGVLNTGDEAALAAADAEQDFLALLVHPKIVRIYNVVSGDDAPDGGPRATYIVMEYVGGRSLRQMRDPRTPMAPAPALAYLVEVLPALAHMHERGLLYCDFKPDNVVQTGTEVKLIDLGAVRRIDDPGGDVWGTVGYQAPEIAPGGAGPSIASDVYTVGRALAVLTLTFDFHRSMRDRLPEPAGAPVLREHEPLHRLLRRATATDPARRFGSVEELMEQMTGVLRQVVATDPGADDAGATTPPPRLSADFGVPRGTAGTTADAPATPAELATTLPLPLADPDDPATPALVAADAAGPQAVLAVAADLDTDQTRLSVALAHLRRGDTDAAAASLAAHRVPHDWAWTWAALLLAAATGDVDTARRAAEEVCDAVPGELAPQVALAALLECGGEAAGPEADPTRLAARWSRVWRTDRTWLAAAFGLARARVALGDRAGALAVLDEVPVTSTHHEDAQVAAVRLLLADRRLPDLLDAGRRLERVDLDPVARAELETEVLEAARAVTAAVGHPDGASPEGASGAQPKGASGAVPGGGTLLGCTLDDEALGRGLEQRYRLRARFAPTLRERFTLVDRANDARPWTRR